MIDTKFKFKFKAVEKPKQKTAPKVKKSKYTYCICALEEDGFVARIQLNKDDDAETKTLVIPFTEQSYSLKGKTKIFTKKPDKDGRIVTVLRDKTLAKLHPGIDSIYTPLRENFVYGGYVVEINNQHFFDITECFNNANVFNKEQMKNECNNVSC